MLFRVVNRTVYVEDLASTNGTRVNGMATGHQVIHHLDLIEVGRHKLHFFDDTLLPGRVGSLESTVHTDFERTMLSAHVPEPRPAARPSRPRDDEFSRTTAIPRDPSADLGPAQERVRTDSSTNAGVVLVLRVVGGERTGDLVSLNRPNTMIGAVGADTALVVRRGRTYFLVRLAGSRSPRLNRREIGPGTHPIAPQDVIDVGGSSYQVISRETMAAAAPGQGENG
jgi:hypothetical protein